MQVWGETYYETFGPVVTWLTVLFLLVSSVIYDYNTWSIDFTLVYPQADLDEDIFMSFPPGFIFNGDNQSGYCLKLLKNIYGLKQARFNWYVWLKEGLTSCGFR